MIRPDSFKIVYESGRALSAVSPHFALHSVLGRSVGGRGLHLNKIRSSMHVEFQASNIHIDGVKVPEADFEMLLRFVCNFVLRVAGVEVFGETEFPFVEFASQVAAWLRDGGLRDFDFESMDSAVSGLVFFHRADDGFWEIGSALPSAPRPIIVPEIELRRGANAFVASVPIAVDTFGVDVRHLLGIPERRHTN